MTVIRPKSKVRVIARQGVFFQAFLLASEAGRDAAQRGSVAGGLKPFSQRPRGERRGLTSLQGSLPEIKVILRMATRPGTWPLQAITPEIGSYRPDMSPAIEVAWDEGPNRIIPVRGQSGSPVTSGLERPMRGAQPFCLQYR